LAIAALCLVTVLGRSLSELEIIVEQRQSALVFLRIIALAVPQLLNTVMPIAVFVAALVALNRLHTEQEIVICFASGMSRWKVISPAMRLASVAAVLSLIIGIWAAAAGPPARFARPPSTCGPISPPPWCARARSPSRPAA
jgi:lipopolysaccharide export system permease protein